MVMQDLIAYQLKVESWMQFSAQLKASASPLMVVLCGLNVLIP